LLVAYLCKVCLVSLGGLEVGDKVQNGSLLHMSEAVAMNKPAAIDDA
jgi:hypothetical protein